MAPFYGFASQLGIDSANPVTKRFNFRRAGVALDEEFRDENGLKGTIAEAGELVAQGIRRVNGTLLLTPNAAEWALLLPWIMGGSTSGSPTVTYALADTALVRFITVDKGQKVPTYDHCFVDRAVIRSQQDGPVELELSVVGVDETLGNSGTFPGLSIDVATTPFQHEQLVLTINSVTYGVRRLEITIDFGIDKDRFFNSLTLSTATNRTRRTITLDTELPYGDASATYGLGVAGVAASAVWTNGGAVLTVPFNNVKYPRKSPVINDRNEEMLPLKGKAYKTGSTLEFGAGVTLNPGP